MQKTTTQSRKFSEKNSVQKPKPSINSVRVIISGPGYRASLYVIDNEILETLRNTPVAEAQYEDNPFSNVVNLALSSCRVCLGLDIGRKNLVAKMFVNEIEVAISKMGFIPEESDVKETLGISPKHCLVAFEDDVEMLSANADKTIESTNNSMFILEVEEYKHGTLSVCFETSIFPTPGDLKLGLVDIDDPNSRVSQITHANGLIGNVEQDIRYLIVDGTKHQFELEISSGYSSNFYLIHNDGFKPEFLDPETTINQVEAIPKSGDKEKSTHLLKISAEAGDLQAMHTLARLYSDPDCHEFNLEKSNELYLTAARNGWTNSQYNIALNYLDGVDGCVQSLEKAYFWAYQVYLANEDANAKSIMDEIEQSLTNDDGTATAIVVNGMEFDTLAAASAQYMGTLRDAELPVLLQAMRRHSELKSSVDAAKKIAKKEGAKLTLTHLADAVGWAEGYKFMSTLYESVQNLPKR
jgi:hypothetical protein